MQVILAPMEGVADASMRRILTEQGGYDMTVSEFVRVVDQLLPNKVFHRLVPELKNGAKTASGVPVRVQLLGQDPVCLADNACRAETLGSFGLDLNFGCPAKTVNKSKGGAVLLKEPEQIYRIVSAVRSALSPSTQLSAKVRLGWDDKSRCVEIAQAVESAGADMLTVHARTKEEGYRPPAHWEYIAQIKEQVKLKLVANGEVWSAQDYQRCRSISGCDDVMIGRGALAMPNLAAHIKGSDALAWSEVLLLLREYASYEVHGEKRHYCAARVKQWLRFLSLCYAEGKSLFEEIRRLREATEIIDYLKAATKC